MEMNTKSSFCKLEIKSFRDAGSAVFHTEAKEAHSGVSQPSSTVFVPCQVSVMIQDLIMLCF